MERARDRIADALVAGVRYQLGQITPENIDAELSRHLGAGRRVHRPGVEHRHVHDPRLVPAHGVRYINTSHRAVGPLRGGGDDAIRSSGRCTSGTWRCAA